MADWNFPPLDSTVVPQADQVERVLEYAVLTALGHLAVRERRFTGRDAHDYRVAAQALGLLDGHGEPSELVTGYCDEPLELLRCCFEASAVGQVWSRWARMPLWRVDPTTAEAFLAAATTLAEATRRRRAKTLQAWLTALRPERDEVVQPSEAQREAEREALLDQSVHSLPLSIRPMNVFNREGITTVREAVTRGRRGLLELRAFGVTTANELDAVLQAQPPYEGLDALHAHILLERENSRDPASAVDPTDPTSVHQALGFDPAECADLVALWEAVVETLEERERRIVRDRSGCFGAAKNLTDLGQEHELTCERIRQIEVRAIERLRRLPAWLAVIDARLRALQGEASYLLLSQLVADPYFARLAERPKLLRYFTGRLLAPTWVAYRWIDDDLVVTREREREPYALLVELRREATAWSWPGPWAALEDLVDAGLARAEADDLRDLMLAQIGSEAAVLGEGSERQVIGIGNTRETLIRLLLVQSPEPVAIAEIYRRFGRGTIPSDSIYISRGHVTLACHVEGFDHWQERLVPEVEQIMAREAPGLQWMAADLHEAVRERLRLPEWLTPMILAAMLRRSGAFDDLRRQRFALLGSTTGERVPLLSTLIEVVADAGEPVAEEELFEVLTRKTKILPGQMTPLRTTIPLFPLGDGRIGLVERDLPGGLEALREAEEALEAELRRRGRGLGLHQAARVIWGLSATHHGWTESMVAVVPRVSVTLSSKRQSIGLQSWDDPRTPTRAELLRRLLDEGQGAVSVDRVQAALTKLYGKPMTRGTLAGVANAIGIRVSGDWLLSKEYDGPSSSLPTGTSRQ